MATHRFRVDYDEERGTVEAVLGDLRETLEPNTTYLFPDGYDLTLVFTPNEDYYIDWIDKNDDAVTDEDSIKPYRYKYNTNEDVEMVVQFTERQEYELTLVAPEDYEVIGSGTYKYLEEVTMRVVAEDYEFAGWYYDGQFVSVKNPYTRAMPDYDVELEALIGEALFDDVDVRQFTLQNADGEVYKLTNIDWDIYLNEPNNLGYTNSLQVQRLGNVENIISKQYSMPQPRGTIMFFNGTNGDKYSYYYEFVRFISKKPLTLWYRIPTELTNNTFHTTVEDVSLDKTEVGVDGILRCNISFYATKLWRTSQKYSERTHSTVTVYNNGDIETGIEIEVKRSNNGAFFNPKILFRQNDVLYGELAITTPTLLSGLTKLILNTKDGEQSIKMYQGSSLVANPFAYIDFSRADGVKQFPFPKLKLGETEIEFTYTGSIFTSDKTYTLNFDEEFISV